LAELANDIEQTAGLKATFFVVPGVLGWLDPNSLAIGHLGKIAASSDLYLQRAAATALMNIHTTDALPFLAKLLDSSDGATRELAMRGLSRFVEGMPIPTHENILSGRATLAQEPTPYRTAETARYSLATRSLAQAPETEAAFLSFWKSWWEAVQGSVVVAGR
jgi:hypothetical protein